MKLASVVLTNVRSFRDETRLEFEGGLSILVGPNGGGKTNLLDAITVIMRRDILPGYQAESRDSGQMRIRQPNHFHDLKKVLSKYSGNEENPQILELEFIFEEADVQNISLLIDNLGLIEDMLNNVENMRADQLKFVRKWNLDEFKPDNRIKVKIRDGKAEWSSDDDPKQTNKWKQYLENFELFSLLLHEAQGPRLHPAFLYFSPFRGSAQRAHFQANLSGTAYSQVLASYFGSTSQSQTSLIQAASLYFAEKRRRLESGAREVGFAEEWKEDPEVKLVEKLLKRLGYSWSLELIDHRKNLYEMTLTRDGVQFDIAQSSSGEKEIVNYILGIFALNLRDGLLFIDEAELHLHPRWQSLLLEILYELIDKTNNQVILSTHSPMFVTPKSVANVIRVFCDEEQVSRLVRIDNPQDQEVKDTVHIINAHNNAKMFFADKVILVEGIQDRLVFERMLDLFDKAKGTAARAEILEVGGKGNFRRYQLFLDKLGVLNAVIADLDYILQVGEGDVKNLFVVDEQKIDTNVLKSKKSRDRVTLAEAIENALEGDDIETIKDVWLYIRARHCKLKADLNDGEKRTVEDQLARLSEQKVYLLRKGEIEDYLPDGAKNIEGTVELTRDWSFENWLLTNWDNGTDELVSILAEIIGVSDNDIEAVKRIMQKRIEKEYVLAG